jgi:hypothetical protein
MAAPTYVGNGGIGASDNSQTVAVPFPSLQANDILLLQLLSAENDTHSQPTGFTSIGTVDQSTNQTSSWWWKRAVGTESGNLTCSRADSTPGDAFFGIMSNWRGARLTGTPFNSAGPTSGSGTAYSSSAITPTYDYSTVICLCNEENNVALGKLTDYTTEAFDVSDTTGDDVEFNACYIYQTTKAAVAAKTGTITNTQSWATITLALWSPIPTTISVGNVGTVTGAPEKATVQIPAIPTTVSSTLAGVTLVDSKTNPADSTNYNVSANRGRIHFSYTMEKTANKHVEMRWHHFWTGSDDYYWVVDTGFSDGQFRLKYYDGSYHELQGGTGYFTDGVAYAFAINYNGPDVSVLLDGTPTLSGSADFQPLETLGRVRHTLATNDLLLASYTWGGGVLAALGPTINAGLKITATKGAISVTGYNATIITPATIACTGGAAAVAGYDSVVNEKTDVAASEAAATVADYDVVINEGRKIAATLVAVTSTGYDAGINSEVTCAVNLSALDVAGLNATIQTVTATTISASLEAAAIASYDPVVNSALVVASSAGSVIVSEYGPVVNIGTNINADPGAASAVGYDADLNVKTTILADSAAVVGVGFDAVVGTGVSTYYMSATGTAANKAAATGAAHPGNYMNLSVHNAETFLPGDTIVISDLGGAYRGIRSPPARGGGTGPSSAAR